MFPKRSFQIHYVLLFIVLAALPALACQNFLGSGNDESEPTAIVTAITEEVSPAEPTVAPTEVPAEPTEAPTAEPIQEPVEESEDSAGEAGIDALEEIFRARRAGLDVDAVRVTMIDEDLSSGEITSQTLVEFIRPDSVHLASEGFEMIVVGGNTYLREEGGDWLQSPVPMGDLFAELLDEFTNPEAVEELLDDLFLTVENVNFIGQEALDGKQTRVYEYTATSSLDDSASQNTIWVGVDDGLLYRQLIDSDNEGVQSRMTMTYEYGEDITIEAPIP